MPERLRTPVLLHLRHGHRAAQGAQRLLRRVPGPVLRHVRFAPLTHALLLSSAQPQLSSSLSSAPAQSAPAQLQLSLVSTASPCTRVCSPPYAGTSSARTLSESDVAGWGGRAQRDVWRCRQLCGSCGASCEAESRSVSLPALLKGVGTCVALSGNSESLTHFFALARVSPPSASDNHVGSRARKEQPG